MMRRLPDSTAIARPPARRFSVRPAALRGPGSLLAMPSGCIASDLRPLGIDERRKVAQYELLLSNETVSPVATYAYVDGRSTGSMQSWSAITIPPFAAIAVTIDVPFAGRSPSRDGLVVEVHADMAQLTLDAGSARSVPPHRRIATLAATALGGIALITGAYLATRPQIVALAAPANSVAGALVDVAYATRGARAIAYRVETPEGLQVRAGTLGAQSGAFRFTLPAGSKAQTYDVKLAVHGTLGDDARNTRIVALAAPAPKHAAAPATISSLATARQIVRSGEPIVVGYRATGDTGTVSLLDSSERTVASAPMSPLGTSTLRAPTLAGDREYAVVLAVNRGDTHAESRIGVVVRANGPLLDTAGESTPADPAKAGADGLAAAPSADRDAPFALPNRPATAGSRLQVAIVRPRSGLRIALTNVSGGELTSVQVPDGARSVSLPVPDVAAETKLLVEATFARGLGQETVIRPIVIHARSNA